MIVLYSQLLNYPLFLICKALFHWVIKTTEKLKNTQFCSVRHQKLNRQKVLLKIDQNLNSASFYSRLVNFTRSDFVCLPKPEKLEIIVFFF